MMAWRVSPICRRGSREDEGGSRGNNFHTLSFDVLGFTLGPPRNST